MKLRNTARHTREIYRYRGPDPVDQITALVFAALLLALLTTPLWLL